MKMTGQLSTIIPRITVKVFWFDEEKRNEHVLPQGLSTCRPIRSLDDPTLCLRFPVSQVTNTSH